MREYLMQGAEVHLENCFGQTALHAAASSGVQEAVCILFQAEPDIDKQDKNGNTPLHVAALSGERDTLHILCSPFLVISKTMLL
jgi:ankyrin repeat protein